jgi:tetratricopeptide (TPR) repeat protein
LIVKRIAAGALDSLTLLMVGLALIPALAVLEAQVPGGRGGSARGSGTGPSSSSSNENTEEAQFHYRVARVALNNNDLTVAARELNEAARLAPSNGLVWYYLGIVESKRGNSTAAVEHTRHALTLGLPPKETEDAEQLVAEATYSTLKTGANVKDVLYGVGFGLTIEQVQSRGIRLGPREASQYGARYNFAPREDAIGGEQQVSLYFGDDGLQRIWIDFGDGWPYQLEKSFSAAERLLPSRGFQVLRRDFPPGRYRSENPLPELVEFRNGSVAAGLLTALELRPTVDGPVAFVNSLRLIIYDSARCPNCR